MCKAITSGDNFADALAGSDLSAVKNVPILLVYSDAGKLFDNQKAYLARLKNCTFTILGGYNAVSEKMAGFLGAYGETTRLAGTILGSGELISDISIRMIFGMTADAPITVK